MIFEICFREGFCCSSDIANNLIFTVWISFSTGQFERWSALVQNINLIF